MQKRAAQTQGQTHLQKRMSVRPVWLCQGEDSGEGRGRPVFSRQGGRLPGSCATDGLGVGSGVVVAGSCLSRMMATIAQPPPTLQHEAGKEEAHCHGHTP